MGTWRPDPKDYKEQGAYLPLGHDRVKFPTLKAIGADFVYLGASNGEKPSGHQFIANYAAANEAGLKVGAVLIFDPCIMADKHSAAFATVVPRDGALLPAVISLDKLADICPEAITIEGVHSELMTLINQVEAHSGKSVILKISPEFEEQYAVAKKFDRNIWLSRNRLEPSYGGRPWLLWSANDAMTSEASSQPLEWAVIQP